MSFTIFGTKHIRLCVYLGKRGTGFQQTNVFSLVKEYIDAEGDCTFAKILISF